MSSTEVFEMFKSVFGEIIPDFDVSRISLTDSPRDLGANSIDRAEIITETMQRLDISVPMVNFASAGTVGEIVTIMSGQEVRA